MVDESERSRDARRKSNARAAERDLSIPTIVDPSRRMELEADTCEWLRHYLPDVFKFPFTPDQIHSVDEVDSAIKYGSKKCIAGPRGDGKTSIVRYGGVLKGMLSRECKFALYVGASDPKASESERAIKDKLRTGCRERGRHFYANTPLGEDYPFECAIASYVSRAPSRANNVTVNGGWRVHVQWAGDQLILPSLERGDIDTNEAWEKWMIKPGVIGSILVSCGITSSLLQGANVLDMRPTAVILDDLDKRESLAVRGSMGDEDGKAAPKIMQIINKTISGMKGQGESMGQVMLCTVTTHKSVAFRYSDPEQEPSWSGERKKRMVAWPTRMDLWDEYITLRQKGMKTKDEAGVTIDRHGRTAHQFYLDNREAMDAVAVLGNYNIHDATRLPDGTQKQVSTLQWCFDFIADEGEEAFKTEYQQEPPEEEGTNRLILTAYHVQHNARSGLDQRIVPPETIGIACGLDIKKVGFHYVVWAFSDTPTRSACIEYNFHETKFAGDELRVEDAERAILNGLHEWREAMDSRPFLDMDGREFLIDLALIDQGWKHETWASQPADHFCAESGLNRFLPCKGWGDGQYRKPQKNRKIIVGDNLHVSFSGVVPHVNWNTDHWKMKVHEGFLTAPGEPGSLTLFTPSSAKGGRRQQPHMSFAKHITAEVFEERFVPGYRGMVCKWWKDGAQNHYLDAASQGLVARSLLGASTLTASEPAPTPSAAAVTIQHEAIAMESHIQRAW